MQSTSVRIRTNHKGSRLKLTKYVPLFKIVFLRRFTQPNTFSDHSLCCRSSLGWEALDKMCLQEKKDHLLCNNERRLIKKSTAAELLDVCLPTSTKSLPRHLTTCYLVMSTLASLLSSGPHLSSWAHLIYVIICTPPHFLACKLYARKVRQKMASRQNSVN